MRGPGSPDITVLMYAVMRNRLDVVKLLVDRGADMNVKTYVMSQRGRTAYEIAAVMGHGRIADVLMFRNNSVKLTFAYVLFTLLAALPFLSCLVWLYLRYLRHVQIYKEPFLMSLIIAISTLGFLYFFTPLTPVIKSISLFIFVNLFILPFWFVTWKSAGDTADAIDFKISTREKMSLFFSWTCICLVVFWMGNLIESSPRYNEIMLGGLIGWLSTGISILRIGSKHVDKAV